MKKGQIKYLLFDAANTLIHKPLVWERMLSVLQNHGIDINSYKLQTNHKLLSETIEFPDKTSVGFYNKFNAELLLSLGIIPSEILLADIFKSCTYLPWQKFEDTDFISELKIPVGVVSNFNNGLGQILNDLFGNIFTDIIVSEEKQLRKPDLAFYQLAQDAVSLQPQEILYVGDSLKLDMMPGLQMGWNVLLIDRLNLFEASPYAITSLKKLTDIL